MGTLAQGSFNNPDLDPNINVNANTGADIDGHAPVAPTAPTVDLHHNPAVFGTEGKTNEVTDHKTQSFGALVVHLNTPGAQQAIEAIATPPAVATSTVLHDTDGDGFWEQSQWVAGKDDAGNAQGMLVLDRNNNGIIETTDILHLGGDTPGSNNQTNSMAWLDGEQNSTSLIVTSYLIAIQAEDTRATGQFHSKSPVNSSENWRCGWLATHGRMRNRHIAHVIRNEKCSLPKFKRGHPNRADVRMSDRQGSLPCLCRKSALIKSCISLQLA